jgi:hypothetical protein
MNIYAFRLGYEERVCLLDNFHSGKKLKILFYFAYIIDSIDCEDTPDEESESDMLIEEKVSCDHRRHELYIGCESYEKWIGYLHKFLNKKIESYRPDQTRIEDPEETLECEMLEWRGTRGI